MDKKVVRSSYENCLDATARLSAYATSKPFSDAYETNLRQDVLAVDDLTIFCIHARRLVENIGLKDLLRQTTMRASDNTPWSLWKIIGCLIHHDLIQIIRCQTQFRMLQARLKGPEGAEYFEKIENDLLKRPYSEPMSPQVLFKSDRIHYTMIDLTEFIRIFSEKKSLD